MTKPGHYLKLLDRDDSLFSVCPQAVAQLQFVCISAANFFLIIGKE